MTLQILQDLNPKPMLVILTSLLIVLLVEAILAAEKIQAGISPRALLLLRVVVGLLSIAYYQDYYKLSWSPSRVEGTILELLVLIGFLVAWYWTFFDGILNVLREINWFKWGKTKKIDRFFGHTFTGWLSPFFFLFGHFLKWAFLLAGFFALIKDRILGISPFYF